MFFAGRSQIRLLIKILLAIGILIYCVEIQILPSNRWIPAQTFAKPVRKECLCVYRGVKYDLCYHLPSNSSVYGLRFNCSYIAILNRLGLLEDKNGRTVGTSYIDPATDPLPVPVFVTAFSSSHYNEGCRLIYNIRSLWSKQPIIVYDLGLTLQQAAVLKKLCNVQYRIFNFSAYPQYFSSLTHFRWKPVIIAETLNEFGSIWYMDSSVVLKKDNLSHVYDLIRCQRNVRKSQQHVIPSSDVRDEREQRTEHESGWNIEQWKENLKECSKSAYLFHGYTGHGIFPATDPNVYKYIPTNFVEIKKPKAKMYEAGLIFAVRTHEVVNGILRWYVACALEKNCMVGNNGLHCIFSDNDRFSVYGNCHRYDQSVVNLLSANAYYYDRHYYVSEIVDFFNIKRGTELVYDLTKLMKC